VNESELLKNVCINLGFAERSIFYAKVEPAPCICMHIRKMKKGN